jgi:hypothetical protein
MQTTAKEAHDDYVERFGSITAESTPQAPHYHLTEQGILVKCYHKTSVFVKHPVVSFVLGTMISFPLEHWIYEKCYPFTLITKFLGL